MFSGRLKDVGNEGGRAVKEEESRHYYERVFLFCTELFCIFCRVMTLHGAVSVKVGILHTVCKTFDDMH